MFKSFWGKGPASPNGQGEPTASPVAPSGGALFSGLSVKAPDASLPATGGTRPAANTGSAFGFISASPSGSSVASQSSDNAHDLGTSTVSRGPTSGFAFMSESKQSPVAPAVEASAPSTGFSFINAISSARESPPPIPTETAPPAKSGFGFLSSTGPSSSAQQSSVNEKPAAVEASVPNKPQQISSIKNVEESSKRTLASKLSSDGPHPSLMATTNQTSTPALGSFLTAQPVRKKRISSKRPGYARSGDVEEELSSLGPSSMGTQHSATAHQQHAQASAPAVVAESSTSILAGLTVYVESSDTPETSPTGSSLTYHVESGDNSPRPPPKPVKPHHLSDLSQSSIKSQNEEPASMPENSAQAAPGEAEPEAASIPTKAPGAVEESRQAPIEETRPKSPQLPLDKVDNVQIFEALASGFATDLAKVDADLQELLNRESRMKEQKIEFAKRIEEMLEEQNQATQDEDFEKAEQLQIDIDSIRRELSQLEESLGSMGQRQAALDERRDELFRRQLSEVERQVDEAEMASRLMAAKASAASQSVQGERAATKRKLEEKEISLKGRLENARAELSVAQEETTKLKDRVATGTVDLRAERDDWESKVKEIDEEIAELERQLTAKKQQRAIFAKNMADAEEKVQAVASKYSSRLQDAEKRAEQCQAQLDKLLNEESELETFRAESEARLAGEEARLQDLESQAVSAKSKFTVLESLLDRMRQDATLRRKRAAETQKEVKQLQTLQEDFVWKKSRVELMEKELVALETQAMEDGRLLSESAKELPELEHQKQGWVNIRNFKEAGRVASEIKALQAKRQDAQKRLEDSKTEMEGKRTELTALQCDIENGKAELDSMLVRVENEKLRGYVGLIERLQSTIQEIKQAPIAPEEPMVKALSTMLEAELHSVSETASLIRESLGDKLDLTQRPQETATETVQQTEDDQQQEEKVSQHVNEHQPQEDSGEEDLPLEDLESMLDKAIQDEDFELADQLSQRIEAQKNRTTTTSTLQSSNKNDETLEQQQETEVAPPPTTEDQLNEQVPKSQDDVQEVQATQGLEEVPSNEQPQVEASNDVSSEEQQAIPTGTATEEDDEHVYNSEVSEPIEEQPNVEELGHAQVEDEEATKVYPNGLLEDEAESNHQEDVPMLSRADLDDENVHATAGEQVLGGGGASAVDDDDYEEYLRTQHQKQNLYDDDHNDDEVLLPGDQPNGLGSLNEEAGIVKEALDEYLAQNSNQQE